MEKLLIRGFIGTHSDIEVWWYTFELKLVHNRKIVAIIDVDDFFPYAWREGGRMVATALV